MLRVLKPGLLTTLQDEGRPGYLAHGVPASGAVDRYAHRVANLLLGNESGDAALEMTMSGGTFLFDEETGVAVCGADMGARLDGGPVKAWSCFTVSPGAELSFAYAKEGCRCYLAVSGGFDVAPVLGSRSTYVRASLGGFEGRALKAGDALPLRASRKVAFSLMDLPDRYIPRYGRDITLRVLLGPQDDHFQPESVATFLSEPYAVTNRNDRMGYVLEGPAVRHLDGADIVSDALVPGSVQIPGSGMPIVMLADCQTTGGYAKIATVIGPDLGLLAQGKAGDRVRFVRCSDAEAVQALREERRRYREIAELFRR